MVQQLWRGPMKQGRFSIVPIRRTDVFQEVTDRIETLIVSTPIYPGERLPSERELAEKLGVSRTSVRQALKVMEAACRVESRIGSGTYVLEPAKPLTSGLVARLPERVDAAFLRRLISARSGVERAIFKAGLDTIGAAGLKAFADHLAAHPPR